MEQKMNILTKTAGPLVRKRSHVYTLTSQLLWEEKKQQARLLQNTFL